MQRRSRLTGSERFSQIHQSGRSIANRLLVIRTLPNGTDHSRFGFLVSRRIGNAVVRNKVKRRLKETVRLAPIKPGWDVILIARRGIENGSYQTIKEATNNLLRRTHLLADGSTIEKTLPSIEQPQ